MEQAESYPLPFTSLDGSAFSRVQLQLLGVEAQESSIKALKGAM